MVFERIMQILMKMIILMKTIILMKMIILMKLMTKMLQDFKENSTGDSRDVTF